MFCLASGQKSMMSNAVHWKLKRSSWRQFQNSAVKISRWFYWNGALESILFASFSFSWERIYFYKHSEEEEKSVTWDEVILLRRNTIASLTILIFLVFLDIVFFLGREMVRSIDAV